MDSAPATRIVIGLGNPGPKYADSRHNVGFMVLARLRRRWDFGRGRSKFHGRVWAGRMAEEPVMLMAPQTYMNESGRAVAEIAAFYRVAPDRMLVVMDDMALPCGKLRARAEGSAGGHKGLADILSALGARDVPRLRVGIGAPPEHMDGTAHVLGRFDDEQKQVMAEAVVAAADAVELWVQDGIACVMNRYNPGRPERDRPETD